MLVPRGSRAYRRVNSKNHKQTLWHKVASSSGRSASDSARNNIRPYNQQGVLRERQRVWRRYAVEILCQSEVLTALWLFGAISSTPTCFHYGAARTRLRSGPSAKGFCLRQRNYGDGALLVISAHVKDVLLRVSSLGCRVRRAKHEGQRGRDAGCPLLYQRVQGVGLSVRDIEDKEVLTQASGKSIAAEDTQT